MSICTEIIAIQSLWARVLSGTSEEALTHKVLIWVSLGGEVLVAIGILLEIEHPLNLKKILSFAAVIVGVILGAAGTLLLLKFDEAISLVQQKTISTQQSRIIDLDAKTSAAESDAGRAIERAAILSKEAENLRAKNLELEAEIAPRSIDKTGCAQLAEAARPFAGLTVRIATYTLDIDGGSLGWQIAECLWLSRTINVDKELAAILPIGGFGVGVSVSGKNESLVSALKESLEKAKVLIVDGNGMFPGNLEKYRPDATPNPDAVVVVGVKPTILMK